jgi:hypothetical protein
VFAQAGRLQVAGDTLERELAVFDQGFTSIDFQAQEACAFLLGSTAPYPHDLHLGYYSVHSSAQALVKGEEGINAIGRQMQIAGKR